MSESAPFMLDDVKADPGRLRLEGRRGATAVEPRVMDVLVGLAAQGTDVVTREALERQVWPDTHVGYHALARAIRRRGRPFTKWRQIKRSSRPFRSADTA